MQLFPRNKITFVKQSKSLTSGVFRKGATVCFQGRQRADPEGARRVVCPRSDFTAPTGQAGQLLVVKL